MTILIVGLARNLERSATSNISHLIKTFQKYGDVSFFVVESDSNDLTRIVLARLAETNAKFNFTSLGNLDMRYPDRIERLRVCRNHYVTYIRNLDALPDYICVADLDGINNRLTASSLNETFSTNLVWSMCSANQKFGYFDIYALRKQGWCTTDIFEDLQRSRIENRGEMSEFQIRTEVIYKKMRRIPRNSNWIEVDSAFGGLAIYRSHVFLVNDYSVNKQEDSTECEHVTFHRKLRARGEILYINPRMINSYLNEHNIRRYKIARIFIAFVNSVKSRIRAIV
jgi:hypothetical protein